MLNKSIFRLYQKQLIYTLEKASPELPLRKAGHEKDYCKRTVRAASKDTEVQQQFVSQQRSRKPEPIVH